MLHFTGLLHFFEEHIYADIKKLISVWGLLNMNCENDCRKHLKYVKLHKLAVGQLCSTSSTDFMKYPIYANEIT